MMTAPRTYRAKWLLADPDTVVENGYVQVAGDTIVAAGSGTPPGSGPVTDLGSGAMIPPLVNAHTHLELSALRGRLPLDMGLRQWTAELIRLREASPPETLLDHAATALEKMRASGCGAVADISTLGMTRDLLLNAKMGGIFFHEYLGGAFPEPPNLEKRSPLSCSIAAHAPHTTAPSLLKEIFRITSAAGLPMSVHLSESEDEITFIRSARGPWADFLSSRGIDFSTWPIPARSPVHYLRDLGILSGNLMAVHLLQVPANEMGILKKHNISVCLCPRSNRLLHGRLPDIPGFLSEGIAPCLGTDSLASCPTLNILDEMAFVSENFHTVSPREIMAMGTVNGARALGLGDRFGRLRPGYHGPPLYVPVETDSAQNVCRAVIDAGNPSTTFPTTDSDRP